MNRLQRQIEGLLGNYKALESGLEARGIAVKDIVTPSIEKTTEWVYGRSPTRSDGRLSGTGSVTDLRVMGLGLRVYCLGYGLCT